MEIDRSNVKGRNAFSSIAVVLLLLVLASCGGSFRTIESTPVPSSTSSKENVESETLAKECERFVPADYSILALESGDLNQDGLKDAVLALKRKGEDIASQGDRPSFDRPLLLLMRNAKGHLEEFRRNNHVIYCYECGGVWGDPFVEIDVKDGFFEVFHYGGSSWRWSRNIAFSYSKEKNEFFLHHDVSESFHTSDDSDVERVVKTSNEFGSVKFAAFDVNASDED